MTTVLSSHKGRKFILFSSIITTELQQIVFIKIRQPPTLPYRLQHSTIGRLGLNHRVRDGNGCYP